MSKNIMDTDSEEFRKRFIKIYAEALHKYLFGDIEKKYEENKKNNTLSTEERLVFGMMFDGKKIADMKFSDFKPCYENTKTCSIKINSKNPLDE